MNKFNLSKQLIYKLFLSFALLVLFSVSAKANDVYYEQCSSLNDIVDGQTYLLVISDERRIMLCNQIPLITKLLLWNLIKRF